MKSQPTASIIALINSLPARLRPAAAQYARWEAENFFNQQLDIQTPVWDVELYDKRAWDAAEESVRMRFVALG
jgi:hypothetical protein